MDFILVLIELFSLGVTVTADALRAKINRKSAISLQCGQFFDPKFQVDWDVPTNNFCNANECLTPLSLIFFTQ